MSRKRPPQLGASMASSSKDMVYGNWFGMKSHTGLNQEPPECADKI